MKKMVAYFSASGITKKAAENLAKTASADLFEIAPVQPYTRADLNWMDKKSRSTLEMNDPSCRPAMAQVLDVSAYDVIFVGFPIWWYREPSIIDSFLEAYDFKGKTIVPFVTSGSSGIGSTGVHMQSVVGKGAKVLEGKRFSSGVSEDELKKWAQSL